MITVVSISSIPVLASFIGLAGTAGEIRATPRAPSAPCAFVENLGQYDSRAAFVCDAGAATIFATEGGFRVATLDETGCGASVFFSFRDHAVAPTAHAAVPGLHHFLRGADPARWVTGARGFESVEYENVLPGVDVILRARDGGPTIDYVLEPGADVSDLPAIAVEGVDRLWVTQTGDAAAATAIGTLTLTRPLSMATAADGSSRPLASHFELVGERSFRVVVDRPRSDERVLVDPDLVFATLLGGAQASTTEYGTDVTVDDVGAPILTGWVDAPDFPLTPGAFDTTLNGLRDVCVSKFTQDGSALVFSTVIGGNSYDEATAIARGGDGTIYVTGDTQSGNFPVTAGAFDPSYAANGNPDGFLFRLSPSGSALVWSTYFGGVSNEYPLDLVVDGVGSAFVVGHTNSSAYPVTPGAFDLLNSSFDDGFVTKFAPNGNTLSYSTLLGASGVLDSATGIALRANGEAFVTGFGSPGFPVAHDGFDPVHSPGGLDAFVVRLNATGSSLLAGTFLGGASDDQARAIALGPDGAVTVCGEAGNNFPTTPGAFDTTPDVNLHDAFITRLPPSLSSLQYSTLLGADQDDLPVDVAVDAGGAAIVCGTFLNGTTAFPTTVGALETTFGYSFLTRFDPTGSKLSYSTYFSKIAARPEGLAVQSDGSVFVVGQTAPGFPVTPGAYDTTPGGGDIVLAKFDLCPGSITTHGSGCVGTGGFTPSLAVTGCASPGFELAVDLEDALGHSSGLLLLGLGTGALPLNPSCSLAIGPLVPAFVVPLTLFGFGAGGGSIAFTAKVPEVTTPFDFQLQAVIGDPNVAGGIAASNAVKIHLDR